MGTKMKIEALKAHLLAHEGFTPEELAEVTWEEKWGTFAAYGYEYKVFTEEEADQAAKENIRDSLWAFVPSFILEHTAFYKTSTAAQDDCVIEALRLLQERLCEDANPIIRALISNLDEFEQNAIDADGRGHFLAQYDGEEIELDGGKYFAYRIG